MIRKRLLTGQNLPHIRRMSAYFPILVPAAARYGDLRVAAAQGIPLQLLNLLLELGIVTFVDGR